ncbi:MerR family transcriptional regulator [Streptomyces scabiei]|uniref:MerR family transcriptional regulator n=1 Tax=Streptomyces scabiei TaxID=1930 RepID=UPI0029A3BB63|nr:MerR family transcriptional regulator [Streptomyces scabiei]MDX3520715.1 MerR family transcriptional regulator [Streptomyces scabiei]
MLWEVLVVAYPNPDSIEIHFMQLEEGGQIGDLWEAARAAGVKPGTIRVWMTRGKIEPVLDGEAGQYFHLPTIKRAAEGGAKHRPANPAANSRGPHTRAA